MPRRHWLRDERRRDLHYDGGISHPLSLCPCQPLAIGAGTPSCVDPRGMGRPDGVRSRFALPDAPRALTDSEPVTRRRTATCTAASAEISFALPHVSDCFRLASRLRAASRVGGCPRGSRGRGGKVDAAACVASWFWRLGALQAGRRSCFRRNTGTRDRSPEWLGVSSSHRTKRGYFIGPAGVAAIGAERSRRRRTLDRFRVSSTARGGPWVRRGCAAQLLGRAPVSWLARHRGACSGHTSARHWRVVLVAALGGSGG
jgi:hypothetical protein